MIDLFLGWALGLLLLPNGDVLDHGAGADELPLDEVVIVVLVDFGAHGLD